MIDTMQLAKIDFILSKLDRTWADTTIEFGAYAYVRVYAACYSAEPLQKALTTNY